MSKFNATKVSNEPTEVNFMDEHAYRLTEKEELVSKVMTTFLSNAYYMSESQLTSRIIELVPLCGYEFAAKLALYARTKGNMRSVSHLLAAMVCRDSSHPAWLRSFYEHVVIRPDDMSEILACYAKLNGLDIKTGSFRKIPNSIKRAFGKVLSDLSPYQIDKYKMSNKSISLIDLVNLLHPTPTKKNEEAYRRLMHGESLAGTYDSKILEKEMSDAGQNADNEIDLAKNKHDAIKAVLDSGMPIMNLLRNLKNILLYAPDMVDEAISQLTNHDKVVNSRLLPFRFTSAYDVISNMTWDDFSNQASSREDKFVNKIKFESEVFSPELKMSEFEPTKNKILTALETAMMIACENVPELEGNCAILIDHSGSVRGDYYDSSAISKWSSVKTAHIGNLFGSIMAFKQKDVYIGMFGDHLISPTMDRKMGLLEFNKKSYDEGDKCGCATENGLYTFLKSVIAEKKHIDNFIVFSDMEIGDGGEGGWDFTSHTSGGTFQKLFKEFRKINPNCLTVCVNILAQSGTSVFNPKLNLLNVSGWSNAIFDTISMFKQGKLKSLVDEIEQMTI